MAGDDADAVVILHFPAASEYLGLCRSVATQMAAKAQLGLDQLEDARLAVDEAVAQVLGAAAPDSQITCEFTVDRDAIQVSVSAPSQAAAPPGSATFGWIVLEALVDEATATISAGRMEIRIALRRANVEA